MKRTELISLQEKLIESILKTWELFLQIEKEINSEQKEKKCQHSNCDAPSDFLVNFEGCSGCPYYY